MEKQQSKNKSFVGGALILGAVGIIIKVLGAAFRIPLTNIIGDDGMGYYQTAYPIYNLFLTLAIAGIPTAIARMVAEKLAVDKPKDAERVFKVSLLLLSCTGFVAFAVVFFGAGSITKMILEPDAVYCMKAIAPALFFCPVMAAFRGYFQGRQNMRPTAVSQLIEQLFRVAVGLGFAVILLPYGLPKAAAGASLGATIGGLFGFLTVIVIYLRNKKAISAEINGQLADPKDIEPVGKIIKDILVIAVPITIGSAVLPIINAIDTAVVKSRLVSIGFDSDVARGLYGQLTGMAAPLINFPQVLTQAVSISMVPLVASAFKRNETEFMHKNITLALRYALIISLPCALGMSILSKPIMLLLYPMQKESAVNASYCLSILAISIIFLGVIHALTGILQGIGKQIVPVVSLCIGALAKTAVTFFLTGIPALNVKGAAIGTLTAYLVAAVLDYIAVVKFTGTKVNIKLTFLKPIIATAVMSVVAFFGYKVFSKFFGNTISCFATICIAVLVYVVMILFTQSLTAEEIEGLPKGKALVKVLRKIKFIR